MQPDLFEPRYPDVPGRRGVATPFLGDDPGPIPDFLRSPSPANRRAV